MRRHRGKTNSAVNQDMEGKMTARNLLWLALGTLGLPLLVEGTGGCTFASPAHSITPINDNAYTCGCTCNAGSRSPIFVVSTSSDDAEQSGVVMNLGDADLDLGAQIVGLRFPGVALPPGAIIESAVVQFTARENGSAQTDLQIMGLLGSDVPTFAAVDNDLSGRGATAPMIPWSPGPWTAGAAGTNERTPELASLLQELVDQPTWSTSSSVALRFQGTGQRAAVAFDSSSAQAAKLLVTYNPSLHTELPVCATPEIVALNVNGKIPQAAARVDCQERVATTLESITRACGYAQECSCDLVIPPKGDATFDRDVCHAPCLPNQVDSSCADFNPNGFIQCVMANGSDAGCKGYVSATHAGDADPVCVATGGSSAVEPSPDTIGYRIFGHRSTCEVEGSSHIEVGDREPTHDPDTVGTVEILGDPCPGGGCKVAASFGLAMDPITFSVRFASDPTFSDLSASADSRLTTMLAGVDAVFAADGVGGTGNGRRGSRGLAIGGSNQEPLILGIDWGSRLCDLNGNLASTVDGENPDGTCAGDGTTPCTADSPDCDDVGGPCEFEEDDTEEMTVDVSAAGTLVNQPPTAEAGTDQTVECTSTSGASFTLNGAASDPDDNIAVTSWLKGRVPPEVGTSLVTTQSLGVGQSQDFVLRVIDTFAQTDEDDTHVAVVDTTPPQLSLSVSPARLWAPNHKLVTVTATIVATDTCDANPAIRLVSITSNEPDNGLGDGDQPRDIQGAAFGTDDRQFQLRNERGGTGRGRIYTITYSATDASGNATLRQTTVTVPLA
jgi:hypothetical protein